jgi:hypothetical protein
MARDEDDRDVEPVDGNALLQSQAIKIRKDDVEDHAARRDDRRTREEPLRRRIGLDPPLIIADERLKLLSQ